MNNQPDEIVVSLTEILHKLQTAKPAERSDLARFYAVTITEIEKALAYYKTYVLNLW